MNIRYDTTARVFVAEFSSDFAGDLEAIKVAGFKPLGVPPPWIWHAPAPGVIALNRLREKRPASGLTITEEALAVYKPLAETEAKNAEVRKQLADFKKKQKKQRKESEKTQTVPEGKEWVGPEDLPSKPPYVSSIVIVPAPTTGEICQGCGDPLYFYESPTLCLWCDKNNLLDTALDL